MGGLEVAAWVIIGVFMIEVFPALLGLFFLIVGGAICLLFAIAELAQHLLHKLIKWFWNI